MKCILQGLNARIYAKAIQSLAKFGNELFLEADSSGLAIRTINATKSAFGAFVFYPDFFLEFLLDPDYDEENSCKISMKSCMGIFKNMKQVEFCIIQIDSQHSKLNVQLKCTFETIKNHSISIIDVETMTPAFSPNDVDNSIEGNYKIFNEISNNFQMSEEEITLEAKKKSLLVKNYAKGSVVDPKFMRSQLTLSNEEFEDYQIENETSITFCLREYRAFLLFAESVNLNLVVKFQDCGLPVGFAIKNERFEASLVMSTLSEEDAAVDIDSMDSNVTVNPPVKPSKSINIGSEQIRATLKTSSKERSYEDTVDVIRESEAVEHVDICNLNCHVFNKVTQFSLTFQDTEDITRQNTMNTTNNNKNKSLRTIFSRCFEETYVHQEPSPTSQIYVPASDEE